MGRPFGTPGYCTDRTTAQRKAAKAFILPPMAAMMQTQLVQGMNELTRIPVGLGADADAVGNSHLSRTKRGGWVALRHGRNWVERSNNTCMVMSRS